jgi:Tfp pilus assembly protein PilO
VSSAARVTRRGAKSVHRPGLLRVVVAEHRRAVIGLTVALVLNVVVYVAGVAPLARRVANIEQRNQTAELSLVNARREHAQVSGAVTGKSEAAKELATFYERILPPNLVGARRMTLVRLVQLTRQNDLRLVGTAQYTEEPIRDSTLTRLRVEFGVAGDYGDVRSFIHELEAASEFIVIDNIQLQEGGDESGALVLTLDLSTYYRTPS